MHTHTPTLVPTQIKQKNSISTRPQISDTYWTSTPWWRALRSCIFVYGLLSLLLIILWLFWVFFEILFYFLFIHIATRIFALLHLVTRILCAVYHKYGSKFCFLLFCWSLLPCKIWNRSCVSIPSCGTKRSRVEISEPQ